MPVKIDFYHFLQITKVLKQQKNFLKDIVVFTIPTPRKQNIKNAFLLNCLSTNEFLKIFSMVIVLRISAAKPQKFHATKVFCLKVVFYLEYRP